MAFYQSLRVTFGKAFADSIMAALKTVPGGALVTAGKLRLSNDPGYNPQPDSTIAQLDANECSYSGYAAGGIAVVLTAPVTLSTVCEGVLFTALFEAVSATPFVPDTATGWWVDDGTIVIAAERFANNGTAPFGEPGAFLNLTVILPIQLAQSTS